MKHYQLFKDMQYIGLDMSFEKVWLTTFRSFYYTHFHGFINLEFGFLFRKWAALKFFDSASFLKFSPITKQIWGHKTS